MESIDMNLFWGAVYDLWIKDENSYYMTKEEQIRCENRNMRFNSKTDISITLDECIEWNYPVHQVYNQVELCELLGLTGKGDKVAVGRELERRGYIYQTYRLDGKTTKKGYKLPQITPRASTLSAIESKNRYKR